MIQSFAIIQSLFPLKLCSLCHCDPCDCSWGNYIFNSQLRSKYDDNHRQLI